jgi:hypothetical protein
MNKHAKLGAAFLVATGTFMFAGAAPANAAACPNASPALSTLVPLAFTCEQGGFSFTLTSFTGFVGADAISFANPTADSFTISVNSNAPWTTGPNVLNYSVTAPTGKVISQYTSAMQSSVSNPKSGNWDVDGASAGNALATLVNDSSTGGSYSYTPPLPTTETFTSTLSSITGNGIQGLSSTVTVTNAPTPPSSVPGPLPVLGAGAAFGFSRRIRSRIKAAA